MLKKSGGGKNENRRRMIILFIKRAGGPGEGVAARGKDQNADCAGLGRVWAQGGR